MVDTHISKRVYCVILYDTPIWVWDNNRPLEMVASLQG